MFQFFAHIDAEEANNSILRIIQKRFFLDNPTKIKFYGFGILPDKTLPGQIHFLL